MVISSIRSSEAILRTSSVSSVEFPNASNTSFAAIEQRRTRKRITPSQLEQLEELYRQSSHPTREQRDALGKRIQMYAYIRIFFAASINELCHQGKQKVLRFGFK